MADNSTNSGLAKFGDLKKRLLFLIGALIVFRIGSFIPVPGVDPHVLGVIFNKDGQGVLGMMNMFSGGSMERFSIFAIGIMPYISSSIIVQLAAEVIPSLKALKKEGESGRRKITKYTRMGTVLLASLQGLAAAVVLVDYNAGAGGTLLTISTYEFYASTVVCLVTGTMFLMWLGEQITERGVGNGISMLICMGIVAGIPKGIGNFLDLAGKSIPNAVAVLIVVALLLLVYAVVFVESGQRKIPIQYAKRQVGNKIMQGQSTHMPFKLNMAGVIPAIFASSIILLPTTLIGWFAKSPSPKLAWVKTLEGVLAPGKPLYMLLFSVAIIFFCYFYTALTFNPRDTADNLKKSGAFVPGIRPGENTSRYIEKVILNLTFFGALYITAVTLLPQIVAASFSALPFHLGGTSLLIIVVVTMDFRTQIASFMMSQQYDSLMKKANFRNRS